MSAKDNLFEKLGAELAPGQEKRLDFDDLELKGEILPGEPVDFSHGDVDAFEPVPGALESFSHGFSEVGATQAYTVYRGREDILEDVAAKLSDFASTSIDPETELIITPGTQGALFLAAGATISAGDKVAIVEPDYYANRKLVHFFQGELYPVGLDYLNHTGGAGINLHELEAGFKEGVSTFIFSNPNNPSGVVYSEDDIIEIGKLVKEYDVKVIVDELYSRQVFDERPFTIFRASMQYLKRISSPSSARRRRNRSAASGSVWHTAQRGRSTGWSSCRQSFHCGQQATTRLF